MGFHILLFCQYTNITTSLQVSCVLYGRISCGVLNENVQNLNLLDERILTLL